MTTTLKIEQMIANFLWKEGLHTIHWNRLCRPKKGGLGLRKISDTAQVSLLQQVWNSLSDDEALWSQWMRSKYWKQVNFWDAREDSNHSACWKAFLRSRPLALQCMRHQISIGDKSFWRDPWYKEGRLI